MALVDQEPADALGVVIAVDDVMIDLAGPAAAIEAVLRRLGRVGSLVSASATGPTVSALISSSGDGHWTVATSEGTTFDRATAREAGDRLGQVLHGLVARRSIRALYVHAGVVAFDDRVVLLPGRSGAGKSTLVAAALALGATYWSDEYAPVDDAGLVHPYARPLVLRPRDGGAVQELVDPAELGARVAVDARAPDAVVVTTYEPAATWRPEPVGGAAAALAIIDHAVLARSRPRATLSAAARLARTLPVVRGPRGDARSAARAIGDWLHEIDAGDP